MQPLRCGRRRELYDQAVAPTVFGRREPFYGSREIGLTLVVHDSRKRLESPVSHSNRHMRLSLDIADPVRTLPVFSDDVEAPTVLGEPDLDFAWFAAHTSDGRQVKEHGGDTELEALLAGMNLADQGRGASVKAI